MKNNFLIISFLVSFFYFPSLMAFELGVGVRSMGQVVEVGKKLGNSFNVRRAVGSDYDSGEIEYSSSDEIEVDLDNIIASKKSKKSSSSVFSAVLLNSLLNSDIATLYS